ncbi:DUF3105 domain-containing protein [Streptomyces sp. YIM S03343]
MSKTSKKQATTARQAKIEEMRRAQKARDRRNRILIITISSVITAGLIGWGTYAVNSANEKEDQKAAAAKKPIRGEEISDAKKLGRSHVTGNADDTTNPPVGGDHSETWMNCDGTVYTQPVASDKAVHSMEHGAVWVTYNAKASAADIKTLSDRVSQTSYTLMSPYKTQSGPVMLSAWGHQLSVSKASDSRVEQFLNKYVQGAQTPEPGAACSGGQTTP